MAYRYSAAEIARLKAARALCPADINAPTTTGNWVPLYRELSAIMAERIADGTVQGSDLQDMKEFKLWLDVAIGANGDIGMHSAFIRTFTNEQGKLRIGREFSAAEMQKASNGVAFNLWRDISGEGLSLEESATRNLWTVGNIRQIAAADASSIGKNLYGDLLTDEKDSAIAAIAQSHHMTVATRDTQPFIVAGVPIINPWETGKQTG